MTFRAFELAVDTLLSRSSGPLRSVFEIPGIVVQRAFQDSFTPEEFIQSLQDHKKPEEPSKKPDVGGTDLFG